jgi:hypothetical protein
VGLRGTRWFYGGHRKLPRWSPIDIEIRPAIPPSADAAALRDAARVAVLAVCGEPDARVLATEAE